MEDRLTYLTQNDIVIPAPAPTVTVDGVLYQQAGIVIDGVVYLPAVPVGGQIDLAALTDRILAQLKQADGRSTF